MLRPTHTSGLCEQRSFFDSTTLHSAHCTVHTYCELRHDFKIKMRQKSGIWAKLNDSIWKSRQHEKNSTRIVWQSAPICFCSSLEHQNWMRFSPKAAYCCRYTWTVTVLRTAYTDVKSHTHTHVSQTNEQSRTKMFSFFFFFVGQMPKTYGTNHEHRAMMSIAYHRRHHRQRTPCSMLHGTR